MKEYARALIVVAVALAALAGCGYRVIDGRGGLGVDLESIEIRVFENRTDEPGFEQMLASALIEEFARRDWLTPTESAGSGDLIMAGVVEVVRVLPSSYSSVALPVEDRLELSIDVSVSRAVSDEIIWQHPRLAVSDNFNSSPEPNVYESNKEQALRRLSSLISERIHDELFQRF